VDLQGNRDRPDGESPGESSRKFYVRAKTTNAVRRALYRAPGGVRVVGRYDRETIECRHTMDSHSLKRHWPVIQSRLEKAGLVLVGPVQES
jgi:hypothetical protein